MSPRWGLQVSMLTPLPSRQGELQLEMPTRYIAYFDSVMVRFMAQSPGAASIQAPANHAARGGAATQAPKLLLQVEKMHRDLAREMRVKSRGRAQYEQPHECFVSKDSGLVRHPVNP
jgi:hypothetical protein